MAKKMWGARFSKKTETAVEDFTRSIDYDKRLALWDIAGSKLHVTILKKSGFLSKKEANALHSTLSRIANDIKGKKFRFNDKDEDVHTAIQNEVEKKAGKLAFKMHTARSRNDQVIFDVKIFCKSKIHDICALCDKLAQSLARAGKKHEKIIIAGFTHLQHAQLVYLSDYLMGHSEMIKRDKKKLQSIGADIELTLGSGALAGTPIPSGLYNERIELSIGGKTQSFKVKPATNSLDTVSNRDFIIEILSLLSILGMHLSRLAEDLIVWSTKEFGFVELDDAYATGSSLMPQKKNPDVLELIRGYTGVLYGNLVSLLTTMKGLPLSYNRDMQLDKLPLFGSFDIIEKELSILPGLIETLKWNRKLIERRIDEDETLYATDMVYYLVGKGIPFREAHDIIGGLVRESLETGGKIKNMTDGELARFSRKLKRSEIVKLMNPKTSVTSRVSIKRK